MLEVVFSIFVLCLSIVGIIEIFKIISISFFCQKEFDENIVTLIPVYGHREEIEMTLRNAITNAKSKQQAQSEIERLHNKHVVGYSNKK